MRLALGIALIWIGCALLWVAFHGISAEEASPGAIFSSLGTQVREQTKED